MRRYAIVNDNLVSAVMDLEDADVQDVARTSMIVDITDMVPQPEEGWMLNGNKLVTDVASMSQDQIDAYQQKAQRLFGLQLLPQAVDLVGARNLKLSREGTPADVNTLAQQMATVKLLLEGGALKTARTVISMIKAAYPLHRDILDFVTDSITNFLTENGWN